jgi:hypothetical protein
MMPGAPATAAGMTIIGRPSAPNQTGKIVGPPAPLVVVTENEFGEPFGPGSVVVLNVPDSIAVCAGTVIDPPTTNGAAMKLVLADDDEGEEDGELLDFDAGKLDVEVVDVTLLELSWTVTVLDDEGVVKEAAELNAGDVEELNFALLEVASEKPELAKLAFADGIAPLSGRNVG